MAVEDLDGPPGSNPLPDRNVTEETLEDAYIEFIWHCNPALPPESDKNSLRDAFRNPPRSGGQVFSTWTILELVRKFYGKEIKTWTELTVKLGVQPPVPGKEESAQKIAQYGVRLKKWMHSMHVKAFFEYVMGIENEYWMEIPTEPNILRQPLREGIAMEDDMALRALMPHIRPKRGRKRPEDAEENKNSPAQRQRLSPGSAIDDMHAPASAWPHTDVAQTPLVRWPQSAATPTMRNGFWGDDSLEPKSAITPSRPNQRRGAKNVSSAWKLGGQDSGGKTRGRPPINRTPIDTPTVAMFPWMMTKDTSSMPQGSPMSQYANVPMSATSQHDASGNRPFVMIPEATAASQQPRSAQPGSAKSARPSISLQVPERAGAAVRLATPPPPAPPSTNGSSKHSNQTNGNTPEKPNEEERTEFQGVSGTLAPPNSRTRQVPEYYFENMSDRQNVDDVMAYFTRVTHASKWKNPDGTPGEQASIAESSAVINSTLQNMYQSASTTQAFLINLAALAGARMLMTGTSSCTRLGEREDHNLYRCDWEYRFGNLTGFFTMTAKVPFSMWRAPKPETKKDDDEAGEDEDAEGEETTGEVLDAEHWQKKYQQLLEQIDKKDKELFGLRNKVMDSLRESD